MFGDYNRSLDNIKIELWESEYAILLELSHKRNYYHLAKKIYRVFCFMDFQT